MSLLANVAQYSSGYDYSFDTSSSSSMSGGVLAVMIVVYLAVIVFMLAALWKVYAKAGRPGWAAIVPVYNSWVLFEIVGYPGWWALLSFVPFVNIFPAIMMFVAYFKLAKLFGKSDGFAVCTVLFSFVTIPILGFGSSQFQGVAPVAAQVPVAPMAPTPSPQMPVAPMEPQAPTPTTEPSAPSDTTPTPPQQPPVA